MPSEEFEPTISADERPQTYALDRATSGTGDPFFKVGKSWFLVKYSFKLSACLINVNIA